MSWGFLTRKQDHPWAESVQLSSFLLIIINIFVSVATENLRKDPPILLSLKRTDDFILNLTQI